MTTQEKVQRLIGTGKGGPPMVMVPGRVAGVSWRDGRVFVDVEFETESTDVALVAIPIDAVELAE